VAALGLGRLESPLTADSHAVIDRLSISPRLPRWPRAPASTHCVAAIVDHVDRHHESASPPHRVVYRHEAWITGFVSTLRMILKVDCGRQ
jgi:hypothetical protein